MFIKIILLLSWVLSICFIHAQTTALVTVKLDDCITRNEERLASSKTEKERRDLINLACKREIADIKNFIKKSGDKKTRKAYSAELDTALATHAKIPESESENEKKSDHKKVAVFRNGNEANANDKKTESNQADNSSTNNQLKKDKEVVEEYVADINQPFVGPIDPKASNLTANNGLTDEQIKKELEKRKKETTAVQPIAAIAVKPLVSLTPMTDPATILAKANASILANTAKLKAAKELNPLENCISNAKDQDESERDNEIAKCYSNPEFAAYKNLDSTEENSKDLNAEFTSDEEELDVMHSKNSDCKNAEWYHGVDAKIIGIESAACTNSKTVSDYRINACIRFVTCKKIPTKRDEAESFYLRQALCEPDKCDGKDEAQACLDSQYAIYQDPAKDKNIGVKNMKNSGSLIETTPQYKIKVKTKTK